MSLAKILREEIEQNNLKYTILTQLGKKWDHDFSKALNNHDIFIVDGNNVEIDNNIMGKPNRCETNVFNVIKNYYSWYFPVAGVIVNKKSLFMIEHFWIFDKYEKVNIDVTPTGANYKNDNYYIGIINKNVNGEISKAENFFDVDFLKSGNFYSKYLK